MFNHISLYLWWNGLDAPLPLPWSKNVKFNFDRLWIQQPGTVQVENICNLSESYLIFVFSVGSIRAKIVGSVRFGSTVPFASKFNMFTYRSIFFIRIFRSITPDCAHKLISFVLPSARLQSLLAAITQTSLFAFHSSFFFFVFVSFLCVIHSLSVNRNTELSFLTTNGSTNSI